VAIDGGRRRAAAVGLAALLLLIGGAGGVAVDRLVLGARPPGEAAPRRLHGPPDADQILARYRERLALDPEQVKAIRPILVERMRQTSAILERVDPELDRVRRAGDDQVRALLRPEQQRRFDELRAEFEARRAEVRRRLRGEGPPPSP
jgi:hypothetical protein